MACRLAPGIGSGHFLMVAINDFEGDSIAMKERLFSFDVPTVSTLTRGAAPATGGKAYAILGKDFGTFACNRTWCSFDSDLLRCNATRCSAPGEPDSSSIVSHQVRMSHGPVEFGLIEARCCRAYTVCLVLDYRRLCKLLTTCRQCFAQCVQL